MKHNLLSLSFSFILLVASLPAVALAVDLPATAAVPGGVVVVDLATTTRPERVTFNGRPVMMLPNQDSWSAVVGLDLGMKPGQHQLQVHSGQDKPRAQAFTITDKAYETQRLTITNKRMVEPEKRDLERITREQRRISAALENWSDATPATLRFLLPVKGPMSSPFGLRRFFNDQPRRPHSGLDLAAPEGTPIRNPAAGVVTETGDFFFNGNTVFVDHGQGLVTMYCHLSRIDVQPGQAVDAGEVIGAVGKTGRVTGAHLHWGVSLNDARVDPMLFLGELPPVPQP
ncbi:MAG: peptidoglycan DD-metalloendopeptidase family protein [Thiogranum sp.]|nr:peptidoglycan DD-metalloendopeptidase family protein [Thiogranum sp.]